jgi:transcriptional regulator with XRE-family HTH domain
LLGWTQGHLAARAGVSVGTVRGFETGQKTVHRASLAALARALEGAGVTFSEVGASVIGVSIERDRLTD